MAERTNDDWLSSLRHPIDDQALDDLRRILLRGLRAGLRTKGAIADTDLEDSVDPNLAFLAIFSRDCRDFGVIYSDFGYRKQPISYLKIAQI
ncbi:hypothetical protein KFU94_17320 [Chloroflexi bacterium TSY]|nr:hypothetical protein [Chloroflexi bacterium TSY]